MTYSPVRHAPGYQDADNVVDLSAGPQEAALISELRRLQRFLDHEQERERFPHAVDLQPVNRPPNHPHGNARVIPARPADSAVGRLLGKFGLNRRNTANRSRSHNNAPALHGNPFART